MLVVESASNADALRVAKLAQESLSEPIDPADLLHKAREGQAAFFVAREIATNDVVGFAIAEKQETEAHVVAVAIDKLRRGQGIGKALMRELRKDMAAAGALKMSLEVRWDNPKAQDFYRRHGFYPTGLQPHAYSDGSDALRFERPL